MGTIPANELKIRGIAAISEQLATEPEVTITVRGKKRFVVMDIDHYQHLRECELESALLEARADVEEGKVVVESVAAHIKRLVGEAI